MLTRADVGQRRPLTRRARTCTSFAVGLCFWLVVQAALVFTAAKNDGTKNSCFSDPSQPACKDADEFYPLGSVEADMSSLCMMMPWMSGCSLREQCKSGKATGKFCSPWSLLADMCSTEWGETMSGMSGCSNYTALCGPSGSVVEQCFGATNKGLPFLVPTATAISDTLALCREMPDMGQCARCKDSANPRAACPDPLSTLSDICLSMFMSGCTHWATMCDPKPDGLAVVCGEPSQQCVGTMQMYFHSGLQDFVLFKEWVPCTLERYYAAVLGVFVASVAAVLLKVLRFRMERRMAARRRARTGTPRHNLNPRNGQNLRSSLLPGPDHRASDPDAGLEMSPDAGGAAGAPVDSEGAGPRCNLNVAETTLLPTSVEDVRENVVRSLFVGATMTLDYGLMLVAMTFNVGLFFAVVAGAMGGALLFGHAGQKEQRGRGGGGGGGPGASDLQELSFEDEAAGNAALEDRACCQNT